MKGWILAAARLGLGALFLYAALGKARDLGQFAEEIANYQLLPPAAVPWAAAVLPGIEVLAGILLVLGAWARPAALVTGGLLAVFVVGLSHALLRGIDLRCGCFGGTDLATWGTVARDGLLMALAALVAAGGPGHLALANRRRSPPSA